MPTSRASINLAHEALSKLAEISSGMTVKSGWYGRVDSGKNPLPDMGQFGGGAFIGILNGFELRQGYLPSYLDERVRPGVQISFKDLVDNFNAIDNIGYGSEKGEDGKNYIRVERWQWFYQDNVILEINDPMIDDHVINSRLWSRLKTGYSKYIDETELNAVGAFHTKREYTTGIAMESEQDAVCDLIACPYLIELTRRQQFDENQNNVQHTRNWRHDNDAFVIALRGRLFIDDSIEVSMELHVETGTLDRTDGTVISPETMLNTRISPGRNAIRWAERFFEIISRRDKMKFASGTGNAYAKGRAIQPFGFVLLEDSASGETVVENGEIPKKNPIILDDIIGFRYPIKYAQFKAVMENKYGIIRVNGNDYYIKEFEYNFRTTLASFQLIKKAP